MAASIFISYRREDSAAEARALCIELRQKIGANLVFMDTSSIEPGSKWPGAIEEALKTANTVLVVIGPEWLRSADKWGRRRIDQEGDWVRQEVALALKDNKTVIPILVRGARLPPREGLPEDLKELPTRQVIELRRNGWDHDIKLLFTQFRRKESEETDGATVDYPKLSAAPSEQSTPSYGTHDVIRIQYIDHCIVDKDSVEAVIQSSIHDVSIQHHRKVMHALATVKDRYENFDQFVQQCSWYHTLDRAERISRVLDLRSGVDQQYQEISRLIKRNTNCIPILLKWMSDNDIKESHKLLALHTYASFAVLELIMRLQGFQSHTQEAGCTWEADLFEDLPDIPVHLFDLVPHDSTLGRLIFGVASFARCRIGRSLSMGHAPPSRGQSEPIGYILLPVYDAETIWTLSASQDFCDWIYFHWVVPQLVLLEVPMVSRYTWTIVKMRDAYGREKHFANDEWKGW